MLVKNILSKAQSLASSLHRTIPRFTFSNDKDLNKLQELVKEDTPESRAAIAKMIAEVEYQVSLQESAIES